MRFVFLLCAILLTACTTPQTAPQSYYEGVFAPGSVEIETTGEFASRASVAEAANIDYARKAAYARLMKKAEALGFTHFAFSEEKQAKLFRHVFLLSGHVYTEKPDDPKTYRLESIKRLLADLPLEKPKPARKATVPKPSKAKLGASRRAKLKSANNARSVNLANTPKLDPRGIPTDYVDNKDPIETKIDAASGDKAALVEQGTDKPASGGPVAPAKAPNAIAVSSKPCTPDGTNEVKCANNDPPVIFAPQDITGSISRAGGPKANTPGRKVSPYPRVVRKIPIHGRGGSR